MQVNHTRWTLRHHKMDAILSQFFPWMLVHHARKSADFSKIPWSLVLHTSWMLFRHTRGWTFFLHTMDVKDGAHFYGPWTCDSCICTQLEHQITACQACLYADIHVVTSIGSANNWGCSISGWSNWKLIINASGYTTDILYGIPMPTKGFSTNTASDSYGDSRWTSNHWKRKRSWKSRLSWKNCHTQYIPKVTKSNRSWQMLSLQGHTWRLHWPTTVDELSK